MSKEINAGEEHKLLLPRYDFSRDTVDAFIARCKEVMDRRVAETIDVFLYCIGHQEDLTQKKLMDGLSELEKYTSHLQTGEKPLSVLGDVEIAIRSINCIQPLHETIIGVSDLWENSAQLIRSFYRLNIPMKTNLWNVLRRVYTDKKFKELIDHTEFFIDKYGTPHYKKGSILSRLKSYRNLTVHGLGIQAYSLRNEILSLYSSVQKELKIYNHKDGRYIDIYTRAPEELAELAEEAYRHFLNGFEIIENMMVKELQITL